MFLITYDTKIYRPLSPIFRKKGYVPESIFNGKKFSKSHSLFDLLHFQQNEEFNIGLNSSSFFGD